MDSTLMHLCLWNEKPSPGEWLAKQLARGWTLRGIGRHGEIGLWFHLKRTGAKNG